jgi:hypothetical protein
MDILKNNICFELGLGSYADLNETDKLTLDSKYTSIKKSILSNQDWVFATRELSIPLLLSTPNSPLNYVGTLPGNFLTKIGVNYRKPVNIFDILPEEDVIVQNDKIYINHTSNDNNVYLIYVANLPETEFVSENFKLFFTYSVAEALAFPFTRDKDLLGFLNAKKEEYKSLAYNEDLRLQNNEVQIKDRFANLRTNWV